MEWVGHAQQLVDVFYFSMVGQGGRRGNKISWYLRSCVDDLRNGIERENLQPEKLVQTTENFDIKINCIHGQQPFSVHTWLCTLGMCIGGEYFWIVFRRVTRRHFLKSIASRTLPTAVVVAIQIPPSKTLGQIYTIGDRYTDRWRCIVF